MADKRIIYIAMPLLVLMFDLLCIYLNQPINIFVVNLGVLMLYIWN